MRGSIHLGSIAGIRIDVNLSWFLVFILLTASLSIGWFPQIVPRLPVGAYWAASAAAILLFFASVLAHELAHSLVARLRGLPVKSITLFVLGGVSNIEREPQSPGVEFQMALVGPLASLLLGGIFWLVAWLIAVNFGTAYPLPVAVASYLALANVLVGLFNLIPGFPLDGGRVLRSIIWKASGDLDKATRWAAAVGQGFAYLFFAAGAVIFLFGYWLDGVWIAFIGWFLLQAARAETTSAALETTFHDLTVGDVMEPAPTAIEANNPVQRLVDEYFVRHGAVTVPVTQLGCLVGFVQLDNVRRVPQSEWPLLPVGQIMTPIGRFPVAHPAQSIKDALDALVKERSMPVVQDDHLVGVLKLETIERILQARRLLGVTEVQRPYPEQADVR